MVRFVETWFTAQNTPLASALFILGDQISPSSVELVPRSLNDFQADSIIVGNERTNPAYAFLFNNGFVPAATDIGFVYYIPNVNGNEVWVLSGNTIEAQANAMRSFVLNAFAQQSFPAENRSNVTYMAFTAEDPNLSAEDLFAIRASIQGILPVGHTLDGLNAFRSGENTKVDLLYSAPPGLYITLALTAVKFFGWTALTLAGGYAGRWILDALSDLTNAEENVAISHNEAAAYNARSEIERQKSVQTALGSDAQLAEIILATPEGEERDELVASWIKGRDAYIPQIKSQLPDANEVLENGPKIPINVGSVILGSIGIIGGLGLLGFLATRTETGKKTVSSVKNKVTRRKKK